MFFLKVKNSVLFFITAVFLLSASVLSAEVKMTIEDGRNYPGSDYKNVPSLNSAQCLSLCRNDERCRSFTWVREGVQGAQSQCWLKDAVPASKDDRNCISGRKLVTAVYSGNVGYKGIYLGDSKNAVVKKIKKIFPGYKMREYSRSSNRGYQVILPLPLDHSKPDMEFLFDTSEKLRSIRVPLRFEKREEYEKLKEQISGKYKNSPSSLSGNSASWDFSGYSIFFMYSPPGFIVDPGTYVSKSVKESSYILYETAEKGINGDDF